MNYRHAFHAGNFADVLKHAVLALIIEHLKVKATPFRVIDTHAGRGLYDLSGGEAQRTGEAVDGIERLIGPSAAPLPPSIAALLSSYLAAVEQVRRKRGPAAYPGSPTIALELMRPGDRLIANELHPEDSQALRSAIGQDARAKVLTLDGWQALKAVLPPIERRGVVLIDPPFEQAGEFDRMNEGLAAALRRFAHGIYLLWFPIKDLGAVARFRSALTASSSPKLLLAQMNIGTPTEPGRLHHAGLAIVNPPFRLQSQIQELLPFLAKRMAQGQGAEARTEVFGDRSG